MAIDKKTDDYHITRPAAQSRGQAFLQFLYNPRTHEVLGRTAKSWFQIIVFYIILYAFLAGFFAGLLMVFFQTLNVNQPTWTMDASLIGTNPGVGFRPIHPSPDQSAIVFNSKDKDSVAMWTKAVDDFLAPYYDGKTEDFNDCTYGPEPTDDKPCRFSVNLKECGKESYGYDTKMPCIYLKLNKIFGWVPDCIPQAEVGQTEMPSDLKDMIGNLTTQEGSNNVWVSCTAASDNEADSKDITFTYDGHFGFPSYYYPYKNQKNYRTPFVALQVHNLPDDVSVRVSCRLWANNINVDRQRRLGMATFEMQSKTKA